MVDDLVPPVSVMSLNIIMKKGYVIGVLAIIGFPGLAGFFSKDEILWKAYIGGGPILWGIGVLAAGCTSFYMVRLLCLTFYGPNRSDHHTREHLHETSSVMWAPLTVLAAMSALVGYLGVPHVLGGNNLFAHYLEPVMFIPPQMESTWSFLKAQYSHSLEFTLMGSSIAVMFISSGFAVYPYAKGPKLLAAGLRVKFSGIYDTLLNKYYIDEFYGRTLVQPLHDMATFLWKIIDVVVIDGVVNGVGQLCALAGGLSSFRMSGSVHRHAMVFVLGLVCLLTVILI